MRLDRFKALVTDLVTIHGPDRQKADEIKRMRIDQLDHRRPKAELDAKIAAIRAEHVDLSWQLARAAADLRDRALAELEGVDAATLALDARLAAHPADLARVATLHDSQLAPAARLARSREDASLVAAIGAELARRPSLSAADRAEVLREIGTPHYAEQAAVATEARQYVRRLAYEVLLSARAAEGRETPPVERMAMIFARYDEREVAKGEPAIIAPPLLADDDLDDQADDAAPAA